MGMKLKRSLVWCFLAVIIISVSGIEAAENISVVNAKDYGFDETDATDALQTAINSGAQKVVIPNVGKEWIVNRTINLVSNQVLYFEPGVVIVAEKGAFQAKGAVLFDIDQKKNITLIGYGATLKMQKADYMSPDYEKSEWRHILQVRSSENIHINGLTCRDSGGDGIYLGVGWNAQPYNKDIYLRDVTCDNNYRQGISVISVQNLLIENCVFTNTSGISPMAGIDFEPNRADELLQNCVVTNCFFENNEKRGIHINAFFLTTNSAEVEIRIENCQVKNSEAGISITSFNDNGPKGSIEINNCQVTNTKCAGIQIHDKASSATKVIFKDCVLKETAQEAEFPIYFKIDRIDNAKNQGGVEFVGCIIEHKIPKNFLEVTELASNYGLFDIRGDLTVRSSYPVAMGLGATEHHEFDVSVVKENLHRQHAVNNLLRDCEPISNTQMTVRGGGVFLLSFQKGETVNFQVTCRRVRSQKDSLRFMVISPQGKLLDQEELSSEQTKEISFTALEDGVYQISCYAAQNAIEINAEKPLGIYLSSNPFKLVNPVGRLYFWLSEGLTEVKLKVEGEGRRGLVKATLFNSEGAIFAERDNISGFEPYEFRINLRQPSKGELWSLELDKPTAGVLRNVSLTFDDSIPTLSFSPAAFFYELKEAFFVQPYFINDKSK